ncbi:MAG: AAA family ATPase [Oligoflexia bacterium]|nr:AAA family ATPase [Oligoflexia bacterium]
MTIKAVLDDIDVLIRARYPLLYLLTHEEARLESLIHKIAENQKKKLYSWTATRGLVQVYSPEPSLAKAEKQQLNDPVELISHIGSSGESALYLLKDFHPFLDDPHVVRRLRDVCADLKSSYKNILLCSPRMNLPVELEKDVTLIDVPLPDIYELFELLKSVCESLAQSNQGAVRLNSQEASALARAAQGLTLSEAENVFAKAIAYDSMLSGGDLNLVLQEKQQLIRKSGILDFYPADAGLSDVGGLSALKSWLSMRGRGFSPQAAEFGLPSPKGILLLGAPGTGKSLTAKAVARAWSLPLLRLDFGRIFSGLVGSSEENMRRALKVAESVAPAVLWVDEIEKGLAGGSGSGQSDGGTAARVFGTFLTWMQETRAKVFVVATANKIEILPPELLRKGRFDEIFFVDLPEAPARMEILSIHLRKRKRPQEKFDLKRLAEATAGFSGAELEHCIVEAMFHSFSENREVTTEDVAGAAAATVPLSVTYAEEIRRTREWAKSRARPAEARSGEPVARKSGSHVELKK